MLKRLKMITPEQRALCHHAAAVVAAAKRHVTEVVFKVSTAEGDSSEGPG